MSRTLRQDLLRTFDQMDLHYDWLYEHMNFLGNIYSEHHPDIGATLKIILDCIRATQDELKDLRSKV